MNLTHRSLAEIKRSGLTELLIAAMIVSSLLVLFVHVAVGQGGRLSLWWIVHDECVSHWESTRDPAPCSRLEMKNGADRGTVILKDLKGVAQYLVLPTRRISGIESPELQAPDAPNLFAAAWDARTLVFERLGKELPRDGIGLAINSSISRSQDLAHVHVDCLRADVRAELARRAPQMAAGWASEPITLDGVPYRVLRIDDTDLSSVNPFSLAAQGLTKAKENMGWATIVVIGATFEGGRGGFLLLVGYADLSSGNMGHGEALLDHACSLARGN
jgi:CDP-diacylglycerol pyrophosphatase